MSRHTLAQQLADAIATALDEQRTTQAELAYLSGYSEKHISQMLTGKAMGTLEAWDALAFALNLEWAAGTRDRIPTARKREAS